MNAEEQINKLKQIPPVSKEEKRKKLVTAIVLALATLLSVVFLMFAFVQKQKADMLRVEAENQRSEAEKQRALAEQARIESHHARFQTERAAQAANDQLQQTLAELENCKKGNR